jgi:hypothetical protein
MKGFAPPHSHFVGRRCDAPALRAESGLMIASQTLPALLRPPSAAWSAFARVWNLKSIAVVFYFCLLFIVGRYALYFYAMPFDEWIFSLSRWLRGNLVSGLLLLMAIALVEAFAAAFALRSKLALMLGISVSLVVAAASVPARLWVAGVPVAQRLAEEFTFFSSTFAIWAAVGSLAFWLFNSTREDELARAALEETECRRQSLQGQMVEARLIAALSFQYAGQCQAPLRNRAGAGSGDAGKLDQLPARGVAFDASIRFHTVSRARTRTFVFDHFEDAHARAPELLDRSRSRAGKCARAADGVADAGRERNQTRSVAATAGRQD